MERVMAFKPLNFSNMVVEIKKIYFADTITMIEIAGIIL